MLREAGEGRLERVARVRVRDAELKDMEECYDVRSFFLFGSGN